MTDLSLPELSKRIQNSPKFNAKKNIRAVAEVFTTTAPHVAVWNGDDAAAIPDGDGYLLLAAEGVIPFLINEDPYLAGRSSVIANINDIYAMGGRPLALVDVVSGDDDETTSKIVRGVKDSAERFGVPLVGGHTLVTGSGKSLAVAIMGRAKKLITSFDAAPGDNLVLVYNPVGKWMEKYGFWNSTGKRDDSLIVGDLELLPQAAEAGLVAAGKDVSYAGIVGTALMLAETSGRGINLDLDMIPEPPSGVDAVDWLLAYFSYGFLLAVKDEDMKNFASPFAERSIEVVKIGSFFDGSNILFKKGKEELEFWDWAREPYTGFGKNDSG